MLPHNLAPFNMSDSVPEAEKKEAAFRIYDASKANVVQHYRDMRSHQTVDFYRRMEEKYTFDNAKYRAMMTMEEAFDKLESYVDASDPDFELPNRLHLLQTAEAIRKDGHPDWFQLTGLLHDLGKIMFLWGNAEDGQDASCGKDSCYQQWALGGDTYVLGCQIPDEAVVFPEFNHLSRDMQNPLFSSKYGMYEPHCGLDALCLAWGHDEYMYRMLKANQARLPLAGMDMIRYHSAYPLHQQGAYRHLLKGELDEERLKWVQVFNRYDLYTKHDDTKSLDMKELWPYYSGLLHKYGLGGQLRW